MCGRNAGSWLIRPGIYVVLWSFLLLAVHVADVHAQGRGKIAGKVMDASTGEPLPGVNVIIVDTNLGTATDGVGDYFIANLSPGSYDVRATFIGFRTVTVQDVDVSANSTTQLDFELEEATFELDQEVVVTATRPLVERDNTTSMVRLESAEVTARPTRDFTDVLTSLPGVDNDNGQITIRGGTLDEVAFVVDGARARNPLNHSPYTRINLSAIQELEVITGSYNAEYGEAQSGVINVVTKEGGDQYEVFLDARYEPPGVKHWGVSLYDPSTDLYWENTHARHLEWWIEYPDQWVDPNGIPGSDPRSEWTPEEAYQNYLDTHQPLNDYADIPNYQIEAGLGGPVPFLNDLTFFGTVKYRSEAPLLGNAFRERGEFTDATLKLSYRLGGGKRLMLSGFYGEKEAGWGFQSDTDYSLLGYPFWAETFGIGGRYAYYDLAGYPYSQTNGQTLQFSHVLNTSTLYEFKVARVQALRRLNVFPGDPVGFEASEATRDNLRAVDEEGNPIPGGFANRVGYHTGGYYFIYDDNNTEWVLEGYLSSQVNKYWNLKTGFDFSYYVLDHYNHAKLPDRTDARVYKPFQGAAYAQSKLEFGGLIMNAGLRLDFYNPNDSVYTDLFNPLESGVERSNLYAQLSPRLGVSHPIDENTKLHFSYGHFFQRPPFNDYGEGNDNISGSLNTFILDEDGTPWVLGNRNLRPRKTVAYEVGIERNFWDFFVIDLTGYYKDIRNTIRTITIQSPGVGTYKTTGNGDYADFRGVEFSIRKVPSQYRWGAMWGYVNATTQFSVHGKSGTPIGLTPSGPLFATSGDVIGYHNPRIKAGIFYETPDAWTGVLGAIFSDLSIAVDYKAVFPNENLRQDIFLFDGQKYLRPVDHLTNLRARKEIQLGGQARISPYLEIQNLLNDKWINLSLFERASRDDQQRFVESDFELIPERDANGRPFVDIAKYRNLPRSVIFGLTVEF